MAKIEQTTRCPWCGDDPLYVEYHDREWGRPTSDEQRLFEFLILEGAQAGLSWISILRRRENYRKAFADFDPLKVSRMTERDVECLMADQGIIRNRRKIEGAISNAKLFLGLQKEFGSFHNYVTSFLPEGKRIVNHPQSMDGLAATSSVSDAMSKDMRRRGFTFFGSVICYSFLQATGFVDDHLESCGCKYTEACGFTEESGA